MTSLYSSSSDTACLIQSPPGSTAGHDLLADPRPEWRAEAENLAGALEGGHQGVDFRLSIVQVEARPGGRRQVELLVQNLATVVASADGDALVVEHRADVVGVEAAEIERDDATPPGWVARAVERHVRQLPQALEGVGDQLALVLADGRHADRLEVLDGRAKRDH